MLPNEWPSVSVCRRGSADPGSDPLRTVVWVLGDHEYATRVHLSATLGQAARLDDADVTVDLSGVTFMDASTIGALVDTHNRLRARSRSLSIRAPSRLARRLLDVCGLAFLIDERAAPAGPPLATALDSWVAVPASGRVSDATQPPVAQRAPSWEPARATAPRRREPAGSVQRRTSS